MKTHILILTLALLASMPGSFAQSGKRIYDRHSDAAGVSAVHLSPSVFKILGHLPKLEIASEELDVISAVESVDAVYLLDCDNRETGLAILEDVRSMVKAGSYEQILEMKDGGETVRIYLCGGKTITELVFLAVDGDETAFISIEGRINRERLKKLVQEAVVFD